MVKDRKRNLKTISQHFSRKNKKQRLRLISLSNQCSKWTKCTEELGAVKWWLIETFQLMSYTQDVANNSRDPILIIGLLRVQTFKDPCTTRLSLSTKLRNLFGPHNKKGSFRRMLVIFWTITHCGGPLVLRMIIVWIEFSRNPMANQLRTLSTKVKSRCSIIPLMASAKITRKKKTLVTWITQLMLTVMAGLDAKMTLWAQSKINTSIPLLKNVSLTWGYP